MKLTKKAQAMLDAQKIIDASGLSLEVRNCGRYKYCFDIISEPPFPQQIRKKLEKIGQVSLFQNWDGKDILRIFYFTNRWKSHYKRDGRTLHGCVD